MDGDGIYGDVDGPARGDGMEDSLLPWAMDVREVVCMVVYGYEEMGWGRCREWEMEVWYGVAAVGMVDNGNPWWSGDDRDEMGEMETCQPW